VPTFRGPGGLWKQYRPEQLATPEAFARDPGLVWEWYDWRRQKVAACQPNPGHQALARLEQLLPDFALITQNVDGLHHAAGSRKLFELHGDIWRVRCTGCERTHEDRRAPLPDIPPSCGDCGSLLRPDVVWFGESLPQDQLEGAIAAASGSEVMLVVGTSALVHPAASLPLLAKRSGAFLVEINTEETPLSAAADLTILGSAASVLPEVCRAAGIY